MIDLILIKASLNCNRWIQRLDLRSSMSLWVLYASLVVALFCLGLDALADDSLARPRFSGALLDSNSVVVPQKRGVLTNDVESYNIRVGDILSIKVFGEPELDTETQVDQEGGITLPLIGRVPIRGLTIPAAQGEVVQRYDAKYLINPKVMLTLKTRAPRRYSVLGRVNKPGVFEMPSGERVTLLQAIAMAGGYARLADPTDVRLRRLTERGEEVLRFNAKSMASKSGNEVPLILDNDTVTVEDSTF